MAKSVPVSFRIPSKYVVFLEVFAETHRVNRTEALIQILDFYMRVYLKAKNPDKF
jgi:hypothetical protein